MVIFFLIFWVAFQDTEYLMDRVAGFKILKPCPYEEKWQRLETSFGEVELFTYVFQPPDDSEDPNFLYLLNYMDYPSDLFTHDSTELIQNLFDESIASTIEMQNARLIYSEDIEFKNYPGKISRIEYNGGQAVIKSKMFMIDTRFYYLQVFTSGVNSLNLEIDRFLNSFTLLEN